MNYLKINDQDFSHLVSSLKIGYETLVSDNSGRNANGDTVIDVINRKCKVYVGLRHMTQEEMGAFLASISDYVVSVSFLDAKTKSFKTITAYTGTPEPDYYTIQDDKVLYKPMSLNFIEL
jgi:hypothetical protein